MNEKIETKEVTHNEIMEFILQPLSNYFINNEDMGKNNLDILIKELYRDGEEREFFINKFIKKEEEREVFNYKTGTREIVKDIDWSCDGLCEPGLFWDYTLNNYGGSPKYSRSPFKIHYTIEFPLNKGEGIYFAQKGFVDLIVAYHMKIIANFQKEEFYNIGPIKLCNNRHKLKVPDIHNQIIIEVKTKKDWENWGDILRQIKTYRDLYSNVVKKWWPFPNSNSIKTCYCIISDYIPTHLVEIFNNEDIYLIELNMNDKDIDMFKRKGKRLCMYEQLGGGHYDEYGRKIGDYEYKHL